MIELVPADRRLVLEGPPPVAESDAAVARSRLSSSPEKYGRLLASVARDHAEDLQLLADELDERGAVVGGVSSARFAQLRQVFAALAPEARLVKLGLAGDRPVATFARRDGSVVALEALTHGERQALLFASLAAYLGLDASILLVDALELHVTPERQVGFARGLLGLGAGIQVIAATNSTELLASLPAHAKVSLD